MLRFVRYAVISVLAFICLAAICGSALYLFAHRFDPPATWRNPPLYPVAQNIRVQDNGEWGKEQSDDYNMYIIKVITYSVVDGPDKVRSFYSDRLHGGGWRLDNDWGRMVHAPASDRLNFSWTDGRQQAPSVYFVDVITTPLSSGGCNVEIGVSMFPGY